MTLTPQSTPLTTSVLAPNPSGMTLSGTNTYLIGSDRATSVVLVDPGPAEGAAEHWHQVHTALAGRQVELILLTHHHLDHTGALDHFVQATGAPARAAQQQWCRNAEPLRDGEIIRAAGTMVHTLHTPGHTSDSFSFFLPADVPPTATSAGSVLTGDTILGEGTTMLDHPDGALASYFTTLDTLERLEVGLPVRVLPAHGPDLDSVGQAARDYRGHRAGRVDQLRELLNAHGGLAAVSTPVDADGELVQKLTSDLYPQLPDRVRFAASRTVAAHLQYLIEQG